VTLTDVAVSFGSHRAVHGATFDLSANRVTALIGPSGCGKTTILRAINRMHDGTDGVVRGNVRVGDLDVYARDTEPEELRARVGMVFQRPNPFPTMSIFENVVSGLRFHGIKKRPLLRDAAEQALVNAALWDEVRDRLSAPAVRLSGGQQQRLCIARALAIEPEVLLMDEPCAALDPLSTAQIEELVVSLSHQVTIGLVTHNMFQARRVSDYTAVFLLDEHRVGELTEFGPTSTVFSQPSDSRTRAYINGELG
jgi:phosphate transport system ATP-binding protein